jgi:hypothetical protein
LFVLSAAGGVNDGVLIIRFVDTEFGSALAAPALPRALLDLIVCVIVLSTLALAARFHFGGRGWTVHPANGKRAHDRPAGSVIDQAPGECVESGGVHPASPIRLAPVTDG